MNSPWKQQYAARLKEIRTATKGKTRVEKYHAIVGDQELWRIQKEWIDWKFERQRARFFAPRLAKEAAEKRKAEKAEARYQKTLAKEEARRLARESGKRMHEPHAMTEEGKQRRIERLEAELKRLKEG